MSILCLYPCRVDVVEHKSSLESKRWSGEVVKGKKPRFVMEVVFDMFVGVSTDMIQGTTARPLSGGRPLPSVSSSLGLPNR